MGPALPGLRDEDLACWRRIEYVIQGTSGAYRDGFREKVARLFCDALEWRGVSTRQGAVVTVRFGGE